MAHSKNCPKCGGGMADGYIVDHTQGRSAVAAWREGKPKKSLWLGLKLRGSTAIEITTSRCRRCGFLESYAQ